MTDIVNVIGDLDAFRRTVSSRRGWEIQPEFKEDVFTFVRVQYDAYHILKCSNASVNNPIKHYEAWNKPEKAEEWRAKLPQTENMRKCLSTKNSPNFLTYKALQFLDRTCHQNDTTKPDFSQFEPQHRALFG
ncbi:MAG: hypothetical protein A2Z38_12580 [Planctomycetes bacterium RBG_19FT_COMBO_48_8]|nr:MAG: hypothetical protein A2Z38_12580 [Planctomycetes bacterium RBG_19FT_COMBO_48_8]